LIIKLSDNNARLESGRGRLIAILFGAAIPIIRTAFCVTYGDHDYFILPYHIGNVAFLETRQIYTAHVIATDAMKLWLALNEGECLLDFMLKIQSKFIILRST
jgi:hypothetical protein